MAKRGEKREQLDGDGLTPRMRRFCLELVASEDQNATAAAKAAGYSAKTAHSIAHELLQKPAVKAFLAPRFKARIDRLEKKLELRADRLDERLAAIAYREVDLAVFLDPETGEALQLKDVPEEQRRGIAGVKVRELWDNGAKDAPPKQIGRVVEIKLIPETARVHAIELAYKRLGLLKERLEVTTKLSHEQLLVLAQRIRERKAAARAGAAVGKPGAPARGGTR